MLILNKDIYQFLPNLKVCIQVWLGDIFVLISLRKCCKFVLFKDKE